MVFYWAYHCRREYIKLKERKLKEDYTLESYIDDRGREKRRAVYRGSWYTMGLDAHKKQKLTVTSIVLCALFAVLYIIYMKLSTPSAWCMYVLPIAAAGLIPLVYWGMGLFSMLRTPETMTRVQRETGIGRVMRSAMGCMILLFIAMVGDVIFMARNGNFAAEFPGFALLICAAMTAMYAFRFTKQHYDAIRVTSAPKGGAKA